MAPAAKTLSVKSIAWNLTRGLLLLIFVSQVYALLIYFEFVPNYPDPILEFLGTTYSRLDRLLEGTPKVSDPSNAIPGAKKTLSEQLRELGLISLIIGNVVYGGLLRYYAPPPVKPSPVEAPSASQELSKKQQKKQSGLLKEVEQEKALAKTPKLEPTKAEKAATSAALRRYIIILGRLGQCSIFLFKALTGDAKHASELARHVANTLLSVGLTFAELNGIKWDGGVLDQFFGKGKYGELVDKEEAEAAKEKEEAVADGARLKLR